MFDFRKIVLALVVLAIAIPMVSAQEAIDNQSFNCRTTSTPPLVRIEGVAELAGDVFIVCSGIVPDQGTDPETEMRRDLRANITLNVDVPVTSQGINTSDPNGRILTDALLINSGDQGRCGASMGLDPAPPCVGPNAPAGLPAAPSGFTTGQQGQGAPYIGGGPVFAFPYVAEAKNHGKFATDQSVGGGFSTFGTLEWDDVLLAPGSAYGRQWYMQMRITNVRVNAATLLGQGEFAPAISAIVTLNTTTGTVPLTPDTVVIARPRPSFRVESVRATRRNCDDPRTITQFLDIIELLPNAFKPRIDEEVNSGSAPGDQDNPNTAYFTESGLMLDDVWATTAPNVGNTGVATQGTQFNIQVISPASLDFSGGPYSVSVGSGWDNSGLSSSTSSLPAGREMWLRSNSVIPVTGGGPSTLDNGDIARNFKIEIDEFRLNADPFQINRLRVPISATYNEQVFGATEFRVWYLPLANFANNEGIVKIGAPVPRFAPEIKTAPGFAIVRCRTLLLFPYITNRNGFNTGIAISNTSRDDNPGPFTTNGGANPQTGPCTLYMYGGNNGAANPVAQVPLESAINVPAGGMYLMTLQTGGVVKGPAGQDVGAVGAAPGFEGYAIASCEFQYAHGYAFISDVQVQRVAQGYLALIIPDRVSDGDSEGEYQYLERPASPFNLMPGAVTGGEQLVH